MSITLDFLTQDRSAATSGRSWQISTELLALGSGHLRHSPSMSFPHLPSVSHVAKKAVLCSLCEHGRAWPTLRLRTSPLAPSCSTFLTRSSRPHLFASRIYCRRGHRSLYLI